MVDSFIALVVGLAIGAASGAFSAFLGWNKGTDPFDGAVNKAFPLGRSGGRLKTRLKYVEYHNNDFQWGVEVIACRNPGDTCGRTCTGRIFRSDPAEYSVKY